MSSTNTVTFKVAGNDVLTFMDGVKRKSDQMLSDMIKNARTQGDSSKEQLKLIEQQISQLERKNRIEVEAARRVAALNRDNNIATHAAERDKLIGQANSDFESGKITSYKRDSKIRTYNRSFDEKSEGESTVLKDQLTTLREGEKNELLQTKVLKDILAELKNDAQKQLQMMRENGEEMSRELDENATPIEQFTRDVAAERYLDEQGNGGPGGGKGKESNEKSSSDVFKSLLGIDNLNRLAGTASQMTQTQNGFDLISPASKGIGQMVGSAIGGLLGMFGGPAGAMLGAGLGGSIGSTLGGGVGDFEQRRAMASQEFLANKNSYMATTGKGVGSITNTAGMGISASDFLGALKQIAIQAGNSARAIEQTTDVLSMEKGIGVSRDVSSQLLTYFRGTNKDISNLVSGVMAKGKNSLFGGGDTTFLNEFMQKFNQLHGSLLQTQEKVATGTTFDILSRFNAVGGQFRAQDPRSMGLVNTVQNALVSPGSDSASALSFLALRRSNPNMSMSQLIEERQKGMGSPTYLKSILQMVDSVGGDESFKTMNVAGILGLSGNMAAARRIVQHKDALMSGAMSTQDIEEQYSGDFKGKAESRTTPLEKNTADIKNGLLSGWIDTLGAMEDSFKIAMENAFNGATIQMQNGSINFGSGGVKKNATKKAATKVSDQIGVPGADLLLNLFH